MGCYRKKTNENIGCNSVVSQEDNQKECEIGYALGSSYWNNGYATEFTNTVIDFLLKDIGFECIKRFFRKTIQQVAEFFKKSGMNYIKTHIKAGKSKINEEKIDVIEYEIKK